MPGSALVLIAIGVISVSISAPLASAIAAPALAIAFWRTAAAAGLGTGYTAVVPRARAEISTPQWRTGLRPSAEAGVWLAVHFATWIPSLRLTSVAASTALVCSTPAWLVAWDLVRRRRVRRPVLIGVGLALLGVVVITGVDAGVSADALLGDALALAGGVAAAGYLLSGARARESLSTNAYTLIAYFVCAVALLVVCLGSGTALRGFPATVWWQLGLLTLTAQMLGHSVLNLALRAAGSTVVSLALLLEVPGASLIAWAWLGQVPPAAVIPGAALMLCGLAVVVLSAAQEDPGETKVTAAPP